METCSIVLVREIELSIVNGFILYNKDVKKSKDITVNTSLRAIRAIIYYFQEQEYCGKFKINLIKADKSIKVTYTERELKELLTKPKTKSFSEYRNWVVINFLIATGVRVGELINIQIKDVSFEEAVVKIKKGKSRRERHIPLSKTLFKVLQEYLSFRQYEKDDDYLFCNACGQKITDDSLKHSIASYNRKRGVDKTSIHLFRHTFAKNWILNNGDIFRLQKILGHRSLEIVKEYVNIFGDDLRRDFDLFNPLEQLSMQGTRILMR